MTDENKEKLYALQRVLDKIYFSKSFKTNFSNKPKRFVHKLLDFEKNEFLIKNEETLGYSSNGKRQLKALFLENERKIEKLIIQQFDINDVPIKNALRETSFHGKEVERLYYFLKAIKEVDFPNNEHLNIKDSELDKMLLNKGQAVKLIEENFELLQDALKNNITTKDLINFGYRKMQLDVFNKLLNQYDFFNIYKEQEFTGNKQTIKDEFVWQHFFEKNTWILGYGLDYLFNTELDDKKIEQVTSGSNFNTSGKRIDALLKSMGAINSLCFCELKLSSDPLLKKVKDAYRGESWQISDSLAGAIAQVQRTIQKAIKEVSTKTEIKDDEDNLTGETIFLYNPKAFILIGNLNEFMVDNKINEIKFSSFEMFRKNLKNIDIITYDELYERAFYICNKKE